MKWYHLLLGGLIAGIVCFLIMRWVFDFDMRNSISASFGAGLGGLIAEYIRISLEKKKTSRINNSTSE